MDKPSNLQILLSRAINGEKGPVFKDGQVLEFVFEGGGTAPGGAGAALGLQDGLVYAVALSKNGGDPNKAQAALEAYQTRCFEEGKDPNGINVFDYVNGAMGSSAGVWTMSYLRAGQGHKGVTIFHNCLTNKKFMDTKRFLNYAFHSVAKEILGRGKDVEPVMNLDYLSGVVRGEFDPTLKLDTEAIRNSQTPIRFLVTDVNTKQTLELDTFKDAEDVIKTGISACLVPGIAGKPDLAKPYVDAGRFGRNNGAVTLPGNENKRLIVFTPSVLGSDPGATGFDKAMDSFVIECTRLIAKDWKEGQELVSLSREKRSLEVEALRASHNNELHTYMGPPPGSASISYSCQKADLLLKSESDSYVYSRACVRDALIEMGLLPPTAATESIPLPPSLDPAVQFPPAPSQENSAEQGRGASRPVVRMKGIIQGIRKG